MPFQELIQQGLTRMDEWAWEKAIEFFEQARQENPTQAIAYFFLSLCWLACNDTQKARSMVELGIQKSPANLLGKNILAILDLREGNISRAAANLKNNGMVEHPRLQSFLLLEIEKTLAAQK